MWLVELPQFGDQKRDRVGGSERHATATIATESNGRNYTDFSQRNVTAVSSCDRILDVSFLSNAVPATQRWHPPPPAGSR